MTKSRKNDQPDVLIMGGGPAGLSAFKWCAELGMSAVLVDRGPDLGGQLLSIYNPITNYVGRRAKNGREMLGHFVSQIDGLDTEAVIKAEIRSFDAATITATLSTGRSLSARAAIIATGVRRRRLNVPGEEQFFGRGILESGAKDKDLVKGKRVAIIGGGDAALENALILSESADKVYVIHRRAEFSARPQFVAPAAGRSNIEFVFDATVTEFCGDDRLNSAKVADRAGESQFDVEAALVRVGVQPNTELFAGKIDLDASGYIKIDATCTTSIPNVLAAGDVACPTAPTIQSAAGMASTAAKAIYLQVRGNIEKDEAAV